MQKITMAQSKRTLRNSNDGNKTQAKKKSKSSESNKQTVDKKGNK